MILVCDKTDVAYYQYDVCTGVLRFSASATTSGLTVYDMIRYTQRLTYGQQQLTMSWLSLQHKTRQKTTGKERSREGDMQLTLWSFRTPMTLLTRLLQRQQTDLSRWKF